VDSQRRAWRVTARTNRAFSVCKARRAGPRCPPAFGYNGLRLRHGALVDGINAVTEITADPNDQFAREIDHMSQCVINNATPHTPDEEGLQDQRMMAAIYESARTGKAVKIATPSDACRGQKPSEETF
jgi:hypothetical protein